VQTDALVAQVVEDVAEEAGIAVDEEGAGLILESILQNSISAQNFPQKTAYIIYLRIVTNHFGF
jgi:hypothetical protein